MKSINGNIAITTALVAALAAGCTPQQGPSTFSSNETMRAVPLQFGTVESARAVEIRPGQTRLGLVAGALIGGAGGSRLGRNRAGTIAGTTAGAVAGGATGSALQGSARTAGVEIAIKLDSGGMIAVTQPGDVRDFRRGDRVRITGEGANVRVTR